MRNHSESPSSLSPCTAAANRSPSPSILEDRDEPNVLDLYLEDPWLPDVVLDVDANDRAHQHLVKHLVVARVLAAMGVKHPEHLLFVA